MRHKFFQLTNKSFEEMGASTYKELWDKIKENGFTALEAGFAAVFEKAADSENSFHATLSDALEDRHGDIVKQDWVLNNFKKNPVLLDSHDYSSIEYIIGKWDKIAVKDNVLQGDIKFALSNPRGLLAYNLAKDGFLTALSAGFIPLEFDEKTGAITKSELLEGSMVSVPANPRTLLEKNIGKEEPIVEEKHEIKEETPPTPAPAVSKKSVLVALNERLKKNDEIFKKVATELKGVTPENVNERKRRIWKSLRTAI